MKNSGAMMQKITQLIKKDKEQVQNEQAEEQIVSAASQQSQSPQKSVDRKRLLSVIWKIVFAMRRLVLALPVIIAALWLAGYNRENLPVLVGINLQSNGEFAQMISRDTAVNVPLLITFGCLSLLLFTRKTIYPWLISIFTLAIPILLMLTNGYLG